MTTRNSPTTRAIKLLRDHRYDIARSLIASVLLSPPLMMETTFKATPKIDSTECNRTLKEGAKIKVDTFLNPEIDFRKPANLQACTIRK